MKLLESIGFRLALLFFACAFAALAWQAAGLASRCEDPAARGSFLCAAFVLCCGAIIVPFVCRKPQRNVRRWRR